MKLSFILPAIIALTSLSTVALSETTQSVTPVTGECVGNACGVAELYIAGNGCVRIKNDSNRYVQLTFYLTVPPETLVEVHSRAGHECVGDFLGEYELRFFDPMS